MKLKFKKSPEQIELIKALASTDKLKSQEAQALFVNLIGPVLNTALLQEDTASQLFTNMTFNEDEDPAFAIEPYSDTTEPQFGVWSSALPGGLPTNLILRPVDIVRFNPRRIDSAVSYIKRLLRTGRIDELAISLTRLVQEIMVKDQNDAWMVILSALSAASTTFGGVLNPHVHTVATPGYLGLQDFSKALTLFRRINRSWVGGTPVGGAARPTDMYMSPEMMEQIRAFAYQPVNTKGANNAAPQGGDVIRMEDQARREVWSSAGVTEFFGMQIHELLELGPGSIYTTIFGNAAGSTAFPVLGGTGTSTFNSTTTGNDLIIMVDANKEFAFKATMLNGNGDAFTLVPDDQFPIRAEKVGFYGFTESARMVLETRGVVGIVV